MTNYANFLLSHVLIVQRDLKFLTLNAILSVSVIQHVCKRLTIYFKCKHMAASLDGPPDTQW